MKRPPAGEERKRGSGRREGAGEVGEGGRRAQMRLRGASRPGERQELKSLRWGRKLLLEKVPVGGLEQSCKDGNE